MKQILTRMYTLLIKGLYSLIKELPVSWNFPVRRSLDERIKRIMERKRTQSIQDILDEYESSPSVSLAELRSDGEEHQELQELQYQKTGDNVYTLWQYVHHKQKEKVDFDAADARKKRNASVLKLFGIKRKDS